MSRIVQSGQYQLNVDDLKIAGSGDRMTLSIGPHHPSTHGVLRVILEIEGERIIKATPEVGFLHTGIEKNAEHLTWTQAITVLDRMDYLAPLSNNLGYVLAVEKLLGTSRRRAAPSAFCSPSCSASRRTPSGWAPPRWTSARRACSCTPHSRTHSGLV